MALNWRAFVLYLCVALSIGFVDHRVRREQYRTHVVTEYIPSVLAGTSGSPAKYRILVPFMLDAVTRRTAADPYMVFLASELLFIAAALMVTHVYLRQWFTEAGSVGGTMALAALLPLTFPNTWAHPDSFPDLLLFTAGCLAVAARRDLLLAAILLVGMFNRETMAFLALLWGFQRWPEWRRRETIVHGLLIATICCGVYLALRWARGFEPYEMWMVQKNLTYLRVLPAGFDPYTRIAGFFWIVLLAAPALFAFSASRRPGAPDFLRSAWMTALVFVVIACLFAAIIETRVFLPVLPLLLPGAVAAFTDPVALEGSQPSATVPRRARRQTP
jgi:hypothetical protein